MAENQNARPGTGGLPGRRPFAVADMAGNDAFPGVGGSVKFYAAPGGTIVEADIHGLPHMTLPTANPQIGPFGFHVHEGAACAPTGGDYPFSEAGGHYNPTSQPHPLHAGDLPVLFPNNGDSYQRMYTNRFTPAEVVGRTMIIHEMPDDFRTQPSGDTGMRMACGPIRRF